MDIKNPELFVICQICTAQIAKLSFTLSSNGSGSKIAVPGISYPLMGSMFLSPDTFHDVPPPFLPELDWDNFHCPYGGHRPMAHRDKILTSEGVLNVPMDGSKPYFTEYLGEMGREAAYDRDQEPPPAMSEADAEALVRRNMALSEPKGDKINGKTDTRTRQEESNKSIEAKEEEVINPGDDTQPAVDSEDDAGPVGVLSLTCPLCDRAPFKSAAGRASHLRIVHNIKSPVSN